MPRRIITKALIFSLTLAGSALQLFAADTTYMQTNLASNIPGMAANLDSNLQNPWGMSFSATSPFWVSNQVANTSTLYNAAGVPQSLVVTTPPNPTGQVFNGTSDFTLTPGNPARFIFASLSGTVSGWNPSVSATTAVTAFTALDGAIYTGLAMGSVGSNNYLYAADSRNGKIDVLNASFSKTTLTGSFVDPSVPTGFTPYNIQAINGKLYVTYAIHDQPGGYIGVFDMNGNFLQHVSDVHLDEPWGLTIAPSTFGSLGNALLVGNEGNGMINGFDATTGAFLGTISGVSGPITNDGLWGLAFRAAGSGFDPNTLYFVAGINDEHDGLFGGITPTPEPATLWTGSLALFALVAYRITRRRQAD